MAKRKTKTILKTLYTGLIVPAVQQLTTGLTIDLQATYYLVLTDAGATANGIVFLTAAIAATLVHEHYQELDFDDRDAALLRRASRQVASVLAARLNALEMKDNDSEDVESGT